MSEERALPEPSQIPQKSEVWRWSLARFIAHSRLPQTAAFIPAIGYAILWSEHFSDLLKSEGPLGGSFLPLTMRLHLLWWGAVLMTLGWALYLWKCPNEIKRAASADDYVLEKFQVPSVESVARAQSRARNQIAEFHPDDSRALVLGGLSPQKISRSINYLQTHLENAYSPSYSPHTINLFTLEFQILDHENSWARRTCVLLLCVGAIIFLVPSVEVAFRVIANMLNSIASLRF